MQKEEIKVYISVIVPCYNCEKWISKNIESLINQSVNNFEVIFIDDGSLDNSYTVINSIMQNSNLTYKILRQKNMGVSVARNNGIESATGEYLYFLDADDYIDNDSMKYLVKVLKKYEVDMYFFNYCIVKNKKYYITKNYNKYNAIQNSKDVLIDLLNDRFNFHMCSFLIKKKILDHYKIRFTPDSKFGEDHEFLIKCLCNSDKCIVDNRCLFNYCMHDGSVTSSFTRSRLDSIDSAVRTYEYINNFYIKNDNYNVENLFKCYVAGKLVHNLREFAILGCKDDAIKEMLYKKIKASCYIDFYKYNRNSYFNRYIIIPILKNVPSIYMLIVRYFSRVKRIAKVLMLR